MEQPARRTYIPALTGIRAFAAAWVLLYHHGGSPTPDPGDSIFRLLTRAGDLGVPLFFALSGFLITYANADAFRDRGFKHMGVYYMRRVARVLPVYYVILAISYVIFLWPGRTVDPVALASSLTLTQAYFTDFATRTGVDVAWSLTLEEAFYATIPLLLGTFAVWSANRRWIRIGLTLLGASALLWGIGYALTTWGPHPRGFMASMYHMYKLTYFGRSMEFFVGVFAGLLALRAASSTRASPLGGSEEVGTARPRDNLIVTAIVLGLAGVGLWKALHLNLRAEFVASLAIASLGALLFFIMATRTTWLGNLLKFRFIDYLGKISYVLYLVHHLMPELAGQIFNPIKPSWMDGWGPWPMMVFALIFYNAISAVLYQSVERPCHRFLTRRMRSAAPSRHGLGKDG